MGVALHFVFLRCAEDARGIAKIGALEPQEEGKHMVMRAHAEGRRWSVLEFGPQGRSKTGQNAQLDLLYLQDDLGSKCIRRHCYVARGQLFRLLKWKGNKDTVI